MGGLIYGLHSGDGVIRYVGQTAQDHRRRLSEHVYAAKQDKGYPVYCWMRKHGVENIEMVVLEECDHSSVNEREVAWIDHFGFDALLNIGRGGYDRGHNLGNRSRLGMKDSEETRRRKSEAAKNRGGSARGWKHSAETRARMSASHTGKKHSEETKAKITGRPKGSGTRERRVA